MKTLFVSDLDGTLLHANEKTSAYTNTIINALIETKGMIFSYATARSYSTASKVTAGINAKMPVIVYNGAFVLDSMTQKIMVSNYFVKDDVADIKELLEVHTIHPLVYAITDGVENFTYRKDKITAGAWKFINTRKDDERNHPIDDDGLLYQGEIFYFTCIDTEEKLYPLYERLKNKYRCIYHKDIYTHEQWLEIMPKGATKANAVLQLKEYLHCDQVICFGDGENDIDMFEIADACYAVDNAVEELKAIATKTIDSNNNDGVAKWLNHYFNDEK